MSTIRANDYTDAAGGNAAKVNGIQIRTHDQATWDAGSNTDEAMVSPVKFHAAKMQQSAVIPAAGTAVDFTGIPAWVRRLTLLFANLSTDGASNTLVRLGTSSGIVDAGYAGAVAFSSSGVARVGHTTAFGLSVNTVATTIIHGAMHLVRLNSGLWVAHMVGAWSNTAGSLHGGGSVDIGGDLTTVRVSTVSGTDQFDSGQFRLMWE